MLRMPLLSLWDWALVAYYGVRKRARDWSEKSQEAWRVMPLGRREQAVVNRSRG